MKLIDPKSEGLPVRLESDDKVTVDVKHTIDFGDGFEGRSVPDENAGWEEFDFDLDRYELMKSIVENKYGTNQTVRTKSCLPR